MLFVWCFAALLAEGQIIFYRFSEDSSDNVASLGTQLLGREVEKTLAIDNVTLTGIPALVTQQPNLTVTSIASSTSTPTPGSAITLQVTIRNSGTSPASSEPIRIYRHTSTTAQPASGALVSFAESSGDLAAGDATTKAIRLMMLSTTTTTYYHACVDASDGEQQTNDKSSVNPVAVRVQSAAPPEEVTVDPTTIMGGDIVFAQPIKDETLVIGTPSRLEALRLSVEK